MPSNQPPLQNPGKAFTGNAAQMRDSPWLASEDLQALGGARDFTIAGVVRHENVQFSAGRTKPVVFALKLEGVQRQMILNATNRKSVVKLHGLNTADWLGKRVCLFATENKGRIGEPMCIRIREATTEAK